jgi:DNA-binding NtrC family response regulator
VETTDSQSGFQTAEFRSAAYSRAIRELERFAAHPDVPLLIEGESGTGKTLIARRLHAISPRRTARFETVVLSALEDSLAGSELFGHVAGAYTDARASRSGVFALAHRGTLFLDEIAKASLAIQQKLLHAIEYGEVRPLGSDRVLRVDSRVIAASNVSLESHVEAGRFLPDLYARLATFRVGLPPLRERVADIPILARYYTATHAGRLGKRTPEIDTPLLGALQRAAWPYNLRQLDATMLRLVIEAEDSHVISLDHCRGVLSYLTGQGPVAQELSPHDVEVAVARSGNNVSQAASALGVARTTVYRKLREAQRRRTAKS